MFLYIKIFMFCFKHQKYTSNSWPKLKCSPLAGKRLSLEKLQSSFEKHAWADQISCQYFTQFVKILICNHKRRPHFSASSLWTTLRTWICGMLCGETFPQNKSNKQIIQCNANLKPPHLFPFIVLLSSFISLLQVAFTYIHCYRFLTQEGINVSVLTVAAFIVLHK